MKSFQFYSQKLKIGLTPLTKFPYQDAEIFCKEEQQNASGSIKDRPVLNMILSAFESGKLGVGGTIVEATSGNTGISLAYIGQRMGIKVVLTMPETMSVERRKILQNLGATLVLTDGALGMSGAVNKAHDIAQKTNAVEILQFQNPKNPEAHFVSTAAEIVNQLGGKTPDVFVAGVGTGGTLMGVAKGLKSQFKNIKIVAVEPTESAVLSGQKAGAHQIQGIGAGFVPSLLEVDLLDEIQTVSSTDALKTAQMLNLEYNFKVGISSGANLFACQKLAQSTYKNKVIVTVFPDSSNRYNLTPSASRDVDVDTGRN